MEIFLCYIYIFTSKYIYFTKVNSKYFIYFTLFTFSKSKVNVPPLLIISKKFSITRKRLLINPVQRIESSPFYYFENSCLVYENFILQIEMMKNNRSRIRFSLRTKMMKQKPYFLKCHFLNSTL